MCVHTFPESFIQYLNFLKMYEINENEPPEAAAVIFDQIYSNVWTASIESEASSRDTYPSKNRLHHGKKGRENYGPRNWLYRSIVKLRTVFTFENVNFEEMRLSICFRKKTTLGPG